MGFELQAEGAVDNHVRKEARLVAQGTVGVLAPATGGGSYGAGCRLADGCDALELRSRGNSPATDYQKMWSPA